MYIDSYDTTQSIPLLLQDLKIDYSTSNLRHFDLFIFVFKIHRCIDFIIYLFLFFSLYELKCIADRKLAFHNQKDMEFSI